MATTACFFWPGAALALALAYSAPAAAETQGWYAGASTDDTHVEVYRGLGWEVGGEQPGLSAYGGLRVNKHFSVEFGAMHAADLEWSEYSVTVPGLPPGYNARTTFDATALQASAVGILPFATIFEAYLKAGLAAYRVSGQQTLEAWDGASLSRSVRSSGMDLLLGAGLGATVAQSWHIKVEYQYFGIDRDFLGVADDDPTIDRFSIGVDYRFGRREGR